MIGKIADIRGVRKHKSEGQRIESLCACLSLAGVLLKSGSLLCWLLKNKIVSIIRDVGANSYPRWAAMLGLCEGEEKRLHAKVELAVRLLAVDDVEAVGSTALHVADLHSNVQ